MLQQMYRLPDVIKVTGLSRSSIYLAISKNQFPKRLKLEDDLLVGQKRYFKNGLGKWRETTENS